MTGNGAPGLGRRACVLIFLLALAVRLAAIAAVGFSSLRFGDARAYLFAAKELVRTGHYPLTTEPFYFRAPGYPVFLAAVSLGNPDRIALAKIVNAVLGALAALVLAGLSAKIFRRRGLAIATGAAAALHPGFVFLATDVQSEPLFLLLLLAAGWLLLSAFDRPSSNLALLAGTCLALAALTRPTALALAPLLLAPLADRRYPARVRAHVAASALLGFLAALAPWTLRNAVVYREFVPVNDAGGSAFYQGNSDWMVRFYDVKSQEEYRRWSSAMFADLERQTREVEAASGRSPEAKTRHFVRKALAERRADPSGTARLLSHKVWDWLRPYPSPLFWPPWSVWTVGAIYSAGTLLAIIGLAAAPRPGVRLFVLAYLALTMAVHVAVIVVWRYRVAYWDPVLLLYGAYGAAVLARRESNLLRFGRTTALRLMSPFDRFVRRIAGKPALPPLWLRHHAGPLAAFESSAQDMAAFLDRLGLLEKTDDVLDIGCGAGSMIPELAARLGPGQRYVGFDVHPPSIRWCRKRFRSDPRLRFELARVASPYGAGSGEAVASYRFPVNDGFAGLVLAKSVFTHLFEQDAFAYLREIRRVLRPGRAAIVTAFLFEGEGESAEVANAFPFGDGRVRWRSELRPTAAVAYSRTAFFDLIGQSGLRVQWMWPGYFPGTERITGQDILLLGH